MDESEIIIQVHGLSKSYGPVRALANVAFSVRRGEIFGYLGPNGAGKTTTINILCGLLPRDEGQVKICGISLDDDLVAIKERIGVVPEESNLYPELTCRRNLHYLGELYGLGRGERRTRAAELLEAFDLSDKADRPFGTLSRGMKRRLTVAAALLHRPQVLFLDEPTAGLDVPSARALRSMIRSIHGSGTTVFLTTHNLAEAELLSHRALILVKGHVVAEGTPAELRRCVEKTRTTSVTFSETVSVQTLRQSCPAVRSAEVVDGVWRLEVTGVHEAVAQVVNFAQSQGVHILEITAGTITLEDAFMQILEGSSPSPEVGP